MDIIGKQVQRSNISYPFSIGSASVAKLVGALPTAKMDFGICFDTVDSRIIVSGGASDASNTSLSTSKYSYDGITWIAGPSITAARHGHRMVQFGNDIYITGGRTGTTPLSTCQILNRVTNAFAAASGGTDFTTARYDHGCVVYNGRVYVIGGETTNDSAWTNSIAYTSTLNPPAFTTVGSGITGIWTARSNFGCVVWKGRVWVLGGKTASGIYSNGVYSSTAPETAWTTVSTSGSVFDARAGMQVFVYNDKLYVYGGYNTSGVLSDLHSSVDGAVWVDETTTNSVNLGIPTTACGAALTTFAGQIFMIGGRVDASTLTSNIYTFPQDSQTTYGNLHVVGALHAKKLWSYAIGAYYADLGEYFHCDEELPTGAPVSIVGYRRVGKFNGKNFAGVTTVNSGLYMGEDLKDSPNTVLVGLTGTINMKVDDPSISTGDEITTVGDKFIRKSIESQNVVAIAQTDYSNGYCVVLKK